jgi:hypothetical protein
MGERAGRQSPVPGRQPLHDSGELRSDQRERVSHDRQSDIVNQRTDEHVRRKDADPDPALPTGDSSLRIKI